MPADDISDADREIFDPRLVKNSLENVLASEGGRFFLWYLLDKLGPFRSPLLDDGRVAEDRTLLANAVRQAIGIELLAEIRDANPELARKMEDEAYGRLERQRRGGDDDDDDDRPGGDRGDGREGDGYSIE